MGAGLKAVGTFAIGIGTAAIAGGTALYGMANKAITTTDSIDKLSAKIGISKQGFQEWQYIMGQNGMEVEKLQVGMKTLTQQMDAANDGNKTAKKRFEELGLSFTDTTGKMKIQEGMMNEVIIKLASMENGTEKARLATEFFGKAGQEMMPMLNNGVQGITDLKDRAHELGLVMSDEAVSAGVKLGDTMDDVKSSFGAIVTKIGVEVMPMIQSLCDWLLANMPAIQTVLGVVFDFISSGVSYVIDYIAMLISTYSDWASKNQETIDAVITYFSRLIASAGEIFSLLITLFNDFKDVCVEFWETYGEEIIAVLKPFIDAIIIVVNTAIELIKSAIKIFSFVLKGDWSGLWEEIKNIFANIWNGIVEAVPLILDNIIQIFTLRDKMFLDAGKAIFNAVWEGMKVVWDDLVDWVNDGIAWLLDKLDFWNSSKKEMSKGSGGGSRIDGSHATGLAYVPFDGYIAELHRGERVLTADENNNPDKDPPKQYVFNVVINSSGKPSPAETAKEFERTAKKLVFEL